MASISEGNTGLPCEFCKRKLQKLNLSHDEQNVFVRINWAIPKAKVISEMKALIGMIKRMAE